MIKIITSKPFRVYSYFDEDSFEFIKKTKAELIKENYSISLSKIILLAVIELKEHNSAADIKEKLIVRKWI